MPPIGRYPIIGDCDKCHTEASWVYEFDDGRLLCVANSCWEEEIERDSGKEERDTQFVEDLHGIVRGVRPREGG